MLRNSHSSVIQRHTCAWKAREMTADGCHELMFPVHHVSNMSPEQDGLYRLLWMPHRDALGLPGARPLPVAPLLSWQRAGTL